jgi:thioredoxin 2
MTDTRVVCPHCSTINQLPDERLGDGPRCGKCREPLFGGGPLELSGTSFDRHLAGRFLGALVRTLPGHGAGVR